MSGYCVAWRRHASNYSAARSIHHEKTNGLAKASPSLLRDSVPEKKAEVIAQELNNTKRSIFGSSVQLLMHVDSWG